MQAASAGAKWQWLGWPNYWSESGTPRFLVRMVRNGDLALSRDPPPVHQLMRTTYDLNNIDYGSLMLQTSYLTLRLDQGRLWYDYPNNEVRLTFASSLLEDFGRYVTTDELTDLHRALATEDYANFRTRLHAFMAGMPGEKITGETDCHLILHALCQLMRSSSSRRWAGRTWRYSSPDMSACSSSGTTSRRRPRWSRSRRATTAGDTSIPQGAWWPLA